MDSWLGGLIRRRIEHMFEVVEVPVPVGAADVAVFARDLRCLTADGEAGLVEGIAALEDLKSAAAAAQARLAVALDRAVRARQAAAGVPAEQRGRGVAAQVALARRESPVTGGRHLGLARALVTEMPHTLQGLADGRLSEWRESCLVSWKTNRHLLFSTMRGAYSRTRRYGYYAELGCCFGPYWSRRGGVGVYAA